jgi:predicted CoA-substrate-specific enzyme activase
MMFAGVDIGSSTAKAVVVSEGNIVSKSILPVTSSVAKVAEDVINVALAKARISMSDLNYVVSTGYGRDSAFFANRAIPEIICHARGVHRLIPRARTIIDIGGQDSKIIWVDGRGEVLHFVMNDKCAAGSGRFLEVIANSLGVGLEEMGERSLQSKTPCQISSTCTVFAETEVVSLRAEGKPVEDLIAGVHRAIANRVVLMGSSRQFEGAIVFTGGVAKNIGVLKALEEKCGVNIAVPQEPQFTGALGSALEAEAGYRFL